LFFKGVGGIGGYVSATASKACDELEGGFASWVCGFFMAELVFIIAMPFIYIYFWVVVNSYRFVLILILSPPVLYHIVRN
jgi:hypothetical protein